MFGSHAAWCPGPSPVHGPSPAPTAEAKNDPVPEVQEAHDPGGSVGAVPPVREDDVRDPYAAYALSDGAVVHCRCRAKYQEQARARRAERRPAPEQRRVDACIQDWFPGTASAWHFGHPRLPCACAFCGKTISKE